MFTSWGMDWRIRQVVEAEREELGEYLKAIREPDEDPGDGPDRELGAYKRGWNDCLDAIRQRLAMTPLSCACGNELVAGGPLVCFQCLMSREGKE